MRYPILIAETPRAGKWNHRYIGPQGSEISSDQAATIFESVRASENRGGDNYMAITSGPVRQVDGTSRIGVETLVLYGIDTRKLGPNEKGAVKRELTALIDQLAILVTEQIQWDTEGTDLVVKRKELAEWQSFFSRLPTISADLPGTSDEKRKRKKCGWIVKMTAIGAGMAIASFLFAQIFVSGLGYFSGRENSKPGLDEWTKNYARFLKDLEECGVQVKVKDPNARAKELSKTICSDTCTKPWCECQEPVSSDEFALSPELKSFITTVYGLETKGSQRERVEVTDKIHPLALLQSLRRDRPEPFKEHIGSLLGVSDPDKALFPRDAYGIRRSLHQTGRAFKKLRDEATKIQRLNLPAGDFPLAKMALAATKPNLTLEADKKFGGIERLVAQEPMLPVFSESDWYLADILRQFFTSEPVVVITKGSPKASLREALVQASKIDLEGLEKERESAEERVDSGSKEHVVEAYTRLKDLVRRLRDNRGIWDRSSAVK
jgi:hypothetical protein